MDILFDLHTHTIFNDHAYSTVYENIKCAKEAGLKGIAITDHGMNIADSGHFWHFMCLKKSIPEFVDGIRVIPGVEANIINDSGEIDIDEPLLKRLDVVIASLHQELYFPKNEKTLMNIYKNIVKNPYVNILGHLDRMSFEVDIKTPVLLAKEYGKAVELNQHSLEVSDFYRKQATELAKICKKYQVPVVVNTDAHFCKKVGDFKTSLQMLDEISFDYNLIINTNYERTIKTFCK